jgi:hypothetical protein
MRKTTPRRRRRLRSGTTLVETALVLSLLMLFLFGIFEYARYLLVNQLLANAARDGARYAATNVDKSGTFVTVDEGGKDCIRDYVIQEAKGADKWVENFAVSVFPCDTSDTTGIYANPPVIKPKASYASWNEASFTDRLGVQIDAKYRPVLPAVWLPNGGGNGWVVPFYSANGDGTVTIKIVAASGSEG